MADVTRAFVLLVIASLFLCLPIQKSTAQVTILSEHYSHRFFALRRHNDIQGVEAVYDDYRRNWLRRYNSTIKLGDSHGDRRSDMPHCSRLDGEQHRKMRRVSCGSGHVFRSNLTGLAAEDDINGRDLTEWGVLGYLGYEHLFSDRFFMGLGVTYGVSEIDNAQFGSTLHVETEDLGFHFLGGYQLPYENMLAWNISYITATDTTRRNNNITGSYDTTALAVTGVWYKNFNIREDLRLSIGIDYTLFIVTPDGFTESDGTVNGGDEEWRGDVTSTAMFIKEFDGGEAFARVGYTFEGLNRSNRPMDGHLDLGASVALIDNVALTGAVGGSILSGGYREGRGSLRLVAKF